MDAKDAWKLVLSIGVTIALILHALLPRYEWRTVGDSGMVIVVYDAGRILSSARSTTTRAR
jgi:hypothetical protein